MRTPNNKPDHAPVVKQSKRPTPPDQIPRRITQPSLNDHLEVMTRAIFQAGLSWAIIADRWPSFIAAFDQFDIIRVSSYGECDIEHLMQADGIIHSRKKISGTIANARTLQTTAQQYGSIERYCEQFTNYVDLYRDAHKRFLFLGDLSCYYWLFRTGNRVPKFELWIAQQQTDHPRMREMILAGRDVDDSSERDDFPMYIQ